MNKYISRFLILLSLVATSGCSHNKPRVIKIAANPIPHAQILSEIEPELSKRGVKIRIIEVDDYTSANRLLSEGQIDANFFQHRPYLKQQEEQFGYQFEELVAVHIEPMGVYSQRHCSIDRLATRRLFAIPADPSNQSRALFLLQNAGLIKLENTLQPTIHDLKENPFEIRIKEIDAPFLARTLRDVDFAVIPSNFALQARLDPLEDALITESTDSQYVNIIVIRKGDRSEKLEVLKFVIENPETKKMIKEKFHGALKLAS